jgi:hypothetical protein
LYYWLFDESNGAIPRLDRLEGKVDELEEIYKELLQIINNLGGLQGLENLLITLQQIVQTLEDHEERLKAIEAQLPVYADEVKQGSRPNGGRRADDLGRAIDGATLPDYIVAGTQQETNYTLFELRDRKPIIQASPPTKHPEFNNLKEGDLWIDSLDQIYYWKVDFDTDQGQWVQTFDSGSSGVAVNDDAPNNPDTGQLWFNTRDTELTLYIYYDGVWVPAAPDSPKA